MTARLLLALALTLPALAPAAQQMPPGEVQTWSELVRRDVLVTFPVTCRVACLQDLDDRRSTPELRAAAMVALGSARSFGVVTRLQRDAAEGSEIERRGAIYGLGAHGLVDLEDLLLLLDRESGALRRDVLLALALTGTERGRAAVDRVAADPTDPDRAEAGAIIGWLVDPAGSPPVETVQRYLELRWEAARIYGLVDGRSWRAWLHEDLSRNKRFLDAIVYRGAARLRGRGIADLYLESLFEGEGLDRIRGAVAHMPREVSLLVEAGAWAPASDEEWIVILDTIDRQRLEGKATGLLHQIRLVPRLGSRAAALLVRAGRSEGLPLIELELFTSDRARRIRVCRTLGGSGIKRYSLTLEPLLADPDPAVQAAALVAQLRLDYTPAVEEVGRRLADVEGPAWRPLVDEMCAMVLDPHVRARLIEMLPELEGDVQLAVAGALTRAGRLGTPRRMVAEALREGRVRPEDALEMVRSLGVEASEEEAEILRDLFPLADQFDVNVEIGVALLNNRDPAMLPVLRNALWTTPWQRSLLAAALIVDIDGIDSLRTELDRPPAMSTPNDLRRIGFALGQVGGLEELERLARVFQPSNPILQGATLGALAARTY